MKYACYAWLPLSIIQVIIFVAACAASNAGYIGGYGGGHGAGLSGYGGYYPAQADYGHSQDYYVSMRNESIIEF